MKATDWTARVRDHLASYSPQASRLGFAPDRILLTRGALDTPARRVFAERLSVAFPKATLVDARDRTHMQLAGLLPKGDDEARREVGRRTLVVGTIGQPVKMARETGVVCPDHLAVSPTAYCTYACSYCYLAGSASTLVAPVAKVFVNLEDALDAIGRRDKRMKRPASLYVGKLQDALGLDPLTGFSRVLVPFFATRQHARLVLLTKSDAVDNLLDLGHRGHTIVTWSLNAAAVARDYEKGAPSLARRLEAACRCADAGYPVRFLIMPILPVENWRNHYRALIETIFDTVHPQRITLGSICSYPGALRITERTLGKDNVISRNIARDSSPDGRLRFSRELAAELYRHAIGHIRRRAGSAVPIGLCFEEPDVWRAVGLDPRAGTCNCLW
ncbi:hypothetical protein HQ576_16840 [bacterium]|nr:hypothetical protein [bacterium]